MLPYINLFHLTLLVALLFVRDWMTPTPSYRAHPFHRGGRVTTVLFVSSTYHYISYFALRYLIWSSFQYLIVTCNLFQHTCFSCLKSTFFILSYQLHCCWLDDPHPFPAPTHSTGGRGVDGLWPWPWEGGWGGDPEPGTYIKVRIPPFEGTNEMFSDWGDSKLCLSLTVVLNLLLRCNRKKWTNKISLYLEDHPSY